jgi:[protein-PII] uridylyltransferase
VHARLGGSPPPAPPPLTTRQAALVQRGRLAVLAEPDEAITWTVTVAAPDRPGLFATIAGVLALHRLSVRSAQIRTERGMAIDEWTVVPDRDHDPRPDLLLNDLRRAQAGELDTTQRLAGRDASRRPPSVPPPAPRVEEMPGASETATVLEVRAGDRPGLLYRLGRALALMGVNIRAARVVTLGAEAVDVFYLQDRSGERLAEPAVREAIRLLTDAAG